ncbi:unnamed protein product [Anisakis simplex]|uniref:BZIP domain-containing protein n=1 Tax=Anisakis simplex TaxID=6269 RepID=A0A0M3JUQ2_ANISI|nr:unnamed protein product [Anisakis simplex]
MLTVVSVYEATSKGNTCRQRLFAGVSAGTYCQDDHPSLTLNSDDISAYTAMKRENPPVDMHGYAADDYSLDDKSLVKATSMAFECSSSPSRLCSDDPMLAQFDADQLKIDENFDLTEYLRDDEEDFDDKSICNAIGPKFAQKPLSPSPIVASTANGFRADPDSLLYNESGEQAEDMHEHVDCTAVDDHDPMPSTTKQSSLHSTINNSNKISKRGRPMKITSRSKQAMYAREYRLKHKQLLSTYERRMKEQDEEIATLRKQNQQMMESLNKQISLRNTLAKQLRHYSSINSQQSGHLQVTLADIFSNPSTQQLLKNTKTKGCCVYMNDDSFTVLSCEACNAYFGSVIQGPSKNAKFISSNDNPNGFDTPVN